MIKIGIRIITGFVFLFIGIIHFARASQMAVYVPLPAGSRPLVFLTGLITVLASIGLILNKHAKNCLITLGVTMALTALLVEIPVMLREREYILRVIGLSNIIKLGLASVLLFMALYYKK